MAHIQLKGGSRDRATQLIINGIDFSMEAFYGFEIVEVGEGGFAEVGFRFTIAVGRLDLDTEADVKLTDNVPVIGARVRSMQKDVA